MQLKSKKGLALLMSSAMAATLIFANTVKATETTEETQQENLSQPESASPEIQAPTNIIFLPVNVTTTWHFPNSKYTVTTDPKLTYKDVETQEVAKCDKIKKKCTFGLVPRFEKKDHPEGWEKDLKTTKSLVYGYDSYGVIKSMGGTEISGYAYKGQKFEFNESDEDKYGTRTLDFDWDSSKEELDDQKLDLYVKDNPNNSTTLFDISTPMYGRILDASQIGKYPFNWSKGPINVQVQEPVSKEKGDKNETLKKAFMSAFGYIIHYQGDGSNNQGDDSNIIFKVLQTSDSNEIASKLYNAEPVNLFNLNPQDAKRYKVCLYDKSTKEWIKGEDGNNLNLLDDGAFSHVEPKSYKMKIEVKYDDHGVDYTWGNVHPRYRYEYKNNIVFDVNFNFNYEEKPVSYDAPTMPMAHSIHVTLHDEDEVIRRIPIEAGSKLPESIVPTPVKEGYEFLGWYYKASDEYKLGPRGLEDELLPFNFDRSIYADFDLYAKWKKVEVKEKRPVPNTADC